MVLAAVGCTSGYQLTDGAYGGNGGNGGYGGTNPPPPNDGGSDAGLTDAGFDDGGFLFDGGCNPATTPTGCFPLGSPCYPSSGWPNSGCASGLLCYSYVNDAGATLNTCCQLTTYGTYMCM